MEILDIKNLNIKNKQGKVILKDVTFSINAGDVILLSGQNGSGKSSILEAITCNKSRFVFDGSITFNNINILKEYDNSNYLKQVAYVSQEDENFFTLNPFNEIKQSLLLSLDKENKKNINDEVNRFFDKFNLGENGSYDIRFLKFSKLSGGQKRLVSIMSILGKKEKCSLFVFDELLNNLDVKNISFISNLVTFIHRHCKNSAIILTTHCRIFPCINRLLEISNNSIVESNKPCVCYDCFGKPNNKGYY